jgi:hypothetical protein
MIEMTVFAIKEARKGMPVSKRTPTAITAGRRQQKHA